jgi:hypothetical protein
VSKQQVEEEKSEVAGFVCFQRQINDFCIFNTRVRHCPGVLGRCDQLSAGIFGTDMIDTVPEFSYL